MAKRIVTKIGDVFCVEFGDGTKGYFQYIANDLTMMNSSVIRAFKTHYPINAKIKIEDIVKDNVDFYAHTILRPGIAENAWYKVGKSSDLGLEDFAKVYFGYTIPTDYINNEVIDVDPLTNWVIWKYQIDFINIGKLPPEYHNIEFGSILPYKCIKTRMLRGYYTATTDEYEILKRKPRPEYVSYIKYNKKDKPNTEFYLCFKGNFFEKGIIVENGNITRITRDEAILNHMEIARKKFSDTNWEYKNFITADVFDQVWNS